MRYLSAKKVDEILFGN